VINLVGTQSTLRKQEIYLNFWLGKLKRSLQRSRYRWKGDIKVDFKDTGCEDVDRIVLF
jgi:hypothetical protein